MRTKRHLLAQIRNGAVSVAAVYGTNIFRVALPEKPAENGVWLPLDPNRAFAVENYTAVHAQVGGRMVHLTRQETDLIAAFVGTTMKMRERPC